MTRIIGIDPGSEISGVCVLNGTTIEAAANVSNYELYNFIGQHLGKTKPIIVIEDIAPYNMRLSPQVIDTVKFIGVLTYRFSTNDSIKELKLVPRNSVKKWIFDTCPDICLPRINAKMLTVDKRMVKNGKKGLRKTDGEMRLPSFHYVDDRVVIAALKKLYDIPTPKPGKPNIYGLRDHSWQALATAALIQHQ
jgi:hypothetical protein